MAALMQGISEAVLNLDTYVLLAGGAARLGYHRMPTHAQVGILLCCILTPQSRHNPPFDGVDLSR